MAGREFGEWGDYLWTGPKQPIHAAELQFFAGATVGRAGNNCFICYVEL
jgi:hypothetical protein